MNDTQTLFACFLTRMVVGGIMLREGVGKLQAGFGANEGARGFIEQNLHAGATFHFYRGFLEHTVLPHIKLFSYLVMFGELSVGVLLLLGLLTRWAALVGLWMMVNFALTQGAGFEPANTWAFALLFFVLASSGAGRVLGVDGWLRGRVPDWMA
ncbi:MAG TPA: DoxX family membrane protein [Polyangia bacterium]|nr:DoxX family membrane protein [Polyangia bacterium]